MRLFSLAQVVLLGAAITLASCENKQSQTADQPASGTTSTSQTEQTSGSGSLSENTATSSYKRYALNKAHIKYEVSGWRRGKEELYFDNWGKREARYINVENLTDQGVRPDRTVIVTNGAKMMIANLVQNQGTTMTEPAVDSLMRTPNVDSPEAISDSILSRMHYVRQGTAEVLGQPTVVWFEQSSGTKLYTWRGIVLKQEVKNPQANHTVVAVSIDTTSAIADSMFAAPKGVQYMPLPQRPR
jgi:hypothetical protein